jgi:hypothetical protein
MKNIIEVQIEHKLDTDPDTSYLGEYSDKCDAWSILRREGEYVHNLAEDVEIPEKGREYRYFKPYAGGEEPGSKDYQKYGLQDFQRMEALNQGDWHYIGVVATAFISVESVIQMIYSGGLWGIESDSEKDYLQQVEKDELASLKSQLLELGFTTRQIQRAFREVKTVE